MIRTATPPDQSIGMRRMRQVCRIRAPNANTGGLWFQRADAMGDEDHHPSWSMKDVSTLGRSAGFVKHYLP
jgi:hypothetical protein